MLNYVFSEEIFLENGGKLRGKGAWTFGDRNKTFTLTVGNEEDPLTYERAKMKARAELEEQHHLLYKTIYLHSFEVLKKVKKKEKVKKESEETLKASEENKE